jgi:hypothetical protein
MLNGDEVLAQLKFDKDVNVAAASKWSDDDIKEMMDTYLKTKAMAKETSNNSLYMIAEEKISQLKLAVEFKNKSAKHPKNKSIEVSV